MPKIAVLGSNSFAGSNYVSSALSQGCNVLGISRSQEPNPLLLSYAKHPFRSFFQFTQLDLNHNSVQLQEALSGFEPEIIVDFAGQGMVAESWKNPEQWYRTNILSKVLLHQWLKDQRWLKKYIRISTPEVYGSSNALIDENQNYAPSTPYAVSHAAIDMSLKTFHQQYGFPVITGRFANFYGEHQQLYRITPKAILSVLSARKLPLHGGGKSIRAFIYADDVSLAIQRMIEVGTPGEVYHFSPEKFVSIRELVEKICFDLGVKFSDSVEISAERPGKDHAYLMDSGKARKQLGWEPKVPLEEGISRTINWVRTNFDELSKMSWDYVHRA